MTKENHPSPILPLCLDSARQPAIAQWSFLEKRRGKKDSKTL
jgi:hypothetical protein